LGALKYLADFLGFLGRLRGAIGVHVATGAITGAICGSIRANKQQKPAQIKSF